MALLSLLAVLWRARFVCCEKDDAFRISGFDFILDCVPGGVGMSYIRLFLPSFRPLECLLYMIYIYIEKEDQSLSWPPLLFIFLSFVY